MRIHFSPECDHTRCGDEVILGQRPEQFLEQDARGNLSQGVMKNNPGESLGRRQETKEQREKHRERERERRKEEKEKEEEEREREREGGKKRNRRKRRTRRRRLAHRGSDSGSEELVLVLGSDPHLLQGVRTLRGWLMVVRGDLQEEQGLNGERHGYRMNEKGGRDEYDRRLDLVLPILVTALVSNLLHHFDRVGIPFVQSQ